jgi:hypothetical protein
MRQGCDATGLCDRCGNEVLGRIIDLLKLGLTINQHYHLGDADSAPDTKPQQDPEIPE